MLGTGKVRMADLRSARLQRCQSDMSGRIQKALEDVTATAE